MVVIERTEAMPETVAEPPMDAPNAGSDIAATARQWRLWLRLSWRDIRGRYRRTVLGPLWTVLGNALMIAGLGLVYGYLWGVDVATYLPYFSGGFLAWTLVATTVTESCQAFILNGELIKSTRLPYSAHIARILIRNGIVFLHNIPLHVGVCLLCAAPIAQSGMLLLPLGLALVIVNLAWIGVVLAIVCARYRDVAPLVTILLQLAFFVTPIIWSAERLQGNRLLTTLLVDANPLHSMIDAVRAPLLGVAPSWGSVAILSLSGAAGVAASLALLRRARPRIAYWL